MFKKKSPIEKEWQLFLKKEEKLLNKYGKDKTSLLEKKLQGIMPPGLQDKLELAFYKAFHEILCKGTGIIEKTYSKEKLEQAYKIREYSHTLRGTRKSLKASAKTAGFQTAKNVAGAGIEGAALGLLGIGLPDIPLFLAVIFRSMYTLCLHYGIDYSNTTEKEMLLELMAMSLYRGTDFAEQDAKLNQKLHEMSKAENVNFSSSNVIAEETVRRAAKSLSGELLYLKFLQGIPVAGVVGGLYDGIYLKRITDYAAVKMERRYLLSKMR